MSTIANLEFCLSCLSNLVLIGPCEKISVNKRFYDKMKWGVGGEQCKCPTMAHTEQNIFSWPPV